MPYAGIENFDGSSVFNVNLRMCFVLWNTGAFMRCDIIKKTFFFNVDPEVWAKTEIINRIDSYDIVARRSFDYSNVLIGKTNFQSNLENAMFPSKFLYLYNIRVHLKLYSVWCWIYEEILCCSLFQY